MKLSIYDMDDKFWDSAVFLARIFEKQFPERIGIEHGCIYGPTSSRPISMYVYRTKTSLVVRGNEGQSG